MISLICDDDREWCQKVANALEGEKLLASRIVSALDLAAKAQPDLLVISAQLPDGNGWMAIPEFQAVAPRMRVIVVAASFDRIARLRAVGEMGALAYLEKMDGAEAVRQAAGKFRSLFATALRGMTPLVPVLVGPKRVMIPRQSRAS